MHSFLDGLEPDTLTSMQHKRIQFIRELYRGDNKSEKELQEAECNFLQFLRVIERIATRLEDERFDKGQVEQ